MPIFFHFTSLEDAQKIVASGELWECSYVSGVYAVPEGGALVPGVQCTSMGRTKDRSMAVVFTTDVAPDVCYPEENIWHLSALLIKDAFIVPAIEAQAMLNENFVED